MVGFEWECFDYSDDANGENSCGDQIEKPIKDILILEKPEDLRSCSVDSDCVLVSSKACYSCPYTTINKKYLEYWNDLDDEKEKGCDKNISWPLCLSPEIKPESYCDKGYCDWRY